MVVGKANGHPTYADHDLAYAQLVGPDYCLTGSQQAGHFAALGLADKHLPLGLVLGPDGRKVRSSGGQPPEDSQHHFDAADLGADVLDRPTRDGHRGKGARR